VATLVTESWNPLPPAFAPDGSLVAAVNDSGTVILKTNNWQQTGAMLPVFGGTFACDGSAFLSTFPGMTEIYSLETGELLRTQDYGPVYCLADGRSVILESDAAYLIVRIVEP
jgi:hypothetical protein